MLKKIKGKVRNLISDTGENLQEVSVGEAVEVLGFEKVPSVGNVVSNTPKIVEKLVYKEERKSEDGEEVEVVSPFTEEDQNMSFGCFVRRYPGVFRGNYKFNA